MFAGPRMDTRLTPHRFPKRANEQVEMSEFLINRHVDRVLRRLDKCSVCAIGIFPTTERSRIPLRSCSCRSAAYFHQGCVFCNVFRAAVRRAGAVLIRCEMKRLFADSCVHRGRPGDWIPMFEMRRHIRKQRRADGGYQSAGVPGDSWVQAELIAPGNNRSCVSKWVRIRK